MDKNPITNSGVIPYMNCLFQQPWWLDIVAPGKWNVAETLVGDEVRARLPYVLKIGVFGLKIIKMPQLTPNLGPWLAPSTAKYARQLARQKDLLNALIDQLPDFDYFSQHFHYSITNWLPFYWRGFSATTYYTYVIDDLTDPDRIWAGFLDNIRTDIRKAERKVEVRTDLPIEKFLEISRKTFIRQGKTLPYPDNLVLRLDAASQSREARKIFFAEDALGNIHSVLYLVWDEESAFYLMGGSDPEFRNSGSMSLLIWEAIKFSATVTKKFDFEGSVVEPIERFFRAFGARQMPYFNIQKQSLRSKLFLSGRNILSALWPKHK